MISNRVVLPGQVDLFAKDFKFPQVFRTSLAINQKLPWGIIGTVEFTYTKTLNNVLYYNYRYKVSDTLTGTGDDRPLYSKINISSANAGYTDFIFGTNTNQGSAYNFTVQLQKDDFYGLSAFVAYTYGRAKSMNDGEVILSAAQQWEDLNAFIEGDDYLSGRRGQYAERNASRTPFENIIDLHLAQDFYIDVNRKRNTLQVTFDVFNFTNLLNKEWGRRYYVSGYYGNYPLVKFEGFQADNTTPNFSFTKPKGEVWSIDDAGLMSVRWQAQIGIRYIFN